MDAYTPITPLQPGAEMFERGQSIPLFPPGTFKPLDDLHSRLSNALSEATEIWEDPNLEDDGTDFDEDESSEFEEDSPTFSTSGSNDARRSQATISTFDEIQTPHSARPSEFSLNIDTVRSVEGPQGPHLFRTSTTSTDFDFDYALQLSPVFPKKEAHASINLLNGPQTGSTIREFPKNALTAPRMDTRSGPSEPRNWSAGEVAYRLSQAGFESEICDRLEENEITGAILLDLTFEDLKEFEIQSFGKRHKLWTLICELRGGSSEPSPAPTPFQDISEVGPRRLPKSRDECDGDAVTPITPGTRRRRGRRNRRRGNDPITPQESVSIVAIEQLIPKEHKCERGEKCSKWKRQQKLFKSIQEEGGFPVSPENGGRIMFTGDPGNAAKAPNLLVPGISNNQLRPSSDAIPSFVASSDLLGPGDQPDVPPALQETLVQMLQERDPQDNVRQFLTFQHIEPPVAVPITPLEAESPNFEMFPPLPTLAPTSMGPSPLTGLQALPKLDIPRSMSANAQLPSANHVKSPADHAVADTFSPSRSAAASPSIYRFGTPASEMDVPVSAFPVGPDAPRDMCRSVPPSMHFRDPVARTTSTINWRRGPSLQLPTLGENEVFSPASDARKSTNSDSSDGDVTEINSTSNKLSGETLRSQCSGTTMSTSRKAGKSGRSSTASNFPGVNHAGWMKKRRTRLLRHEWADHHFRLTGTQLAMHANSVPSSSPLDTLNIDEYAVACSSIAANAKLSSKFKALSIAKGKEKGLDNAAFSFQLVPAGKDGEELSAMRRHLEGGKVHHFAVRSVDERIDWLREMMLAKALKEKAGQGYDVQLMRDGSTPS